MQRWKWLLAAGLGGVLGGAVGSGCNMQGGYFGTPAPAGPQPMAGPGMQPAPPQPGGCQGVCGRYFQCKGGASASDQQSCASQCAQANPDPEGLANLQAMDCPSLVALIDGSTPATGPAGAAQPVAATGGAPKMPPPSGPPHVLPVAPGAATPSSFGGPNGAGGRAGATGTFGPTGTPGPGAVATAPGTCASPRTPTSDPQLYALVTKNAWCSFSYSGGTTRNSRVVLGQDGVAAKGSSSEASHSGQFKDGQGNQTGAWGTGGAQQGGERGCWRLDGQELMFSADGRQWVPGGLRVTVNSNGWPILNVGGTEYMVCN